MYRPAKLISLALTAALAAALFGCANGTDTPNFTSGIGTPNPTDSASASPGASGSPSPSATKTSSSPKPPSYPNNPKDYATATATAWASGGARMDATRLAQLADPNMILQLQTWNGIDGHWGYINCDGTAGSSHCLFRNYNGDELTITVVHQYLGQPHAATEGLIDKTQYPNDSTSYALNLLYAWQNGNEPRMSVYSNSTVTSQLKAAPSFSQITYSAGGSGSSGTTYVIIEGAGGDAGKGLKVKIDLAKLTKKNAVVCVVLNNSLGTC